MYRVSILLDSNNNWLSKYIFKETFSNDNYTIDIFEDEKKIVGYDLVFVLGYTKILKEKFLMKNNLVMVVHESDLPEGKGFSPIQWQILEGKKDIKVCLIEAKERVESGDILEKVELNFDGTELYDEIRSAQAEVTIKLINNFLKKYPNFNKTPQKGSPTFYRRRNASDSELDINLSIKKNFPKLRIGNNEEWPSFFKLNGQTYIIKIFKKPIDKNDSEVVDN